MGEKEKKGVRAAGAFGTGRYPCEEAPGQRDSEGAWTVALWLQHHCCALGAFPQSPAGKVLEIKYRSLLHISFSVFPSFPLLKQFQIKFPLAHNYY